MIFLIATNLIEASKINEGSFTELVIWERKHIEEWVRTNPEMLVEYLLIVTKQFSGFSNSDNRLDMLALDKKVNLIVIKLKRTSTADYADLQAIRYAAEASSMTVEKLIPYYIEYCGETLSEEQARDQIDEFVESKPFTELADKSRIILRSEGFSQEITATVLWLRKADIDISCVKITPYKVNEQVVIVPQVIIPLKEAEKYLIKIKEKVKGQSEKSRRANVIKILIENGLVQKGDKIFLKNDLPDYVHFRENDPVFQTEITGKLEQRMAMNAS